MEVLASKLSTKSKIGARLKQLIEKVYPCYNQRSFDYALKAKSLIYDTRQDIFHNGKTLPSNRFAQIVILSSEVSRASLEFVVLGKSDHRLTSESEKLVRRGAKAKPI